MTHGLARRVTDIVACLSLSVSACGDDQGENDPTGGTDTGGSTSQGTSSAVSGTGSTTATLDGTTGGPNAPFSLSSPDGSLVLSIPEGALPLGVDPADLEIVTRSEAQLALEGASYIAAYDLQPDGLEFLEPVDVSWTLDAAPWGISFIHTSLDEVDFLVPLSTERQGDASLFAFEIDHFSQLHAQNEAGVFDVERVSEVGRAPLGGFVTATYTMSVASDSGEFSYMSNSLRVVVEWSNVEQAGWDLSGAHWRPADLDTLTPARRAFEANGQHFGVGATLPPLRCRATGPSETRRRMELSFSAHLSFYRDDGSMFDVDGNYYQSYFEASNAMCDPPIPDSLGDLIDSISTERASFTSEAIDIGSQANTQRTLSAATAAAWSGGIPFSSDSAALRSGASSWRSGDDVGFSPSSPQLGQATTTVVRASGELPLEAGELLVGTLNLEACLAAEADTHSFIYSMVLDSDGVPDNNWEFNPPFDFDLFQGTDRWYQLTWDHTTQTWSLNATQVQADQSTQVVDSGAWAVIEDSHVNFFIPGAEYDPAVSTYRMTAFGHDGQFSQEDRGADVSGGDPSEPLLPIEP